MIIATRLAINSKNVPQTTSGFNRTRPIHVAHKGGNNEAAIAAPTIVPESFLNHITKNAIIPDAKAIHRSKIVGVVLAKISGVNSRNGTIKVRSDAPANATKILSAICFIDLMYVLKPPVAIA
jgi:hypothetical protein